MTFMLNNLTDNDFYLLRGVYETRDLSQKYQPIKKLNDIHWYLWFDNDIKFEIISDNKNTSYQYKSYVKNAVCGLSSS